MLINSIVEVPSSHKRFKRILNTRITCGADTVMPGRQSLNIVPLKYIAKNLLYREMFQYTFRERYPYLKDGKQRRLIFENQKYLFLDMA